MAELSSIDGWNEWSKYVLKELERLNASFDKMDVKIDNLSEKFTDKAEGINSRITKLQIKVAGIAAAASVVTTLVILLLTSLLRAKYGSW